jgi:hypothetical protein
MSAPYQERDAAKLLKEKADPDEPPPVLGTWRRFYWLVVINTLVVYLLLLAFSRYAAK